MINNFPEAAIKTPEARPAPHARFYLPQKPYSIVDAINRYAAGQGSVNYAIKAADADYNGHHLSVHWNDYRRYYIAEYFWGERVVIARGSAASVLEAGIREFKEHQGRGACFTVSLKPEDEHLAASFGLIAGEEAAPAWRTELFGEVSGAFMYERNGIVPGAVAMLAQSQTKAEYDAKIDAFVAARRAQLQRS